MGIKSIKPTADVLALRDAIIAAMRPFGHMQPLEYVAVLGHIAGQTIALLDQRTITATMAMEVLAANVEGGNAEILTAVAMGAIKP